MFKGSRLALLVGLALLAGCAGMEEVPLEDVDLGTYTVTDYKMPITARGAAAYGQRLLGETVTLGRDRILYPVQMDEEDCQHEGYRLTRRPSTFITPFNLGSGLTLSLQEAGITDYELVEIWSECFFGAYLSADHQTLYLPGRGALLILQKS